MTMKKISAELIKAAQGEFPIDLLLKNAQVINVFSGEIYRENVAIWDKFIVGFGDYEAKKTIDLDGLYLAPGFIDGHVHTESSMVEIPQFARAVVPRGTTSVVCDPHEIANVMGYDGIRYILESSKYNPLNVFIMLPSCVPATALRDLGLGAAGLRPLPLLLGEVGPGPGRGDELPGAAQVRPRADGQAQDQPLQAHRRPRPGPGRQGALRLRRGGGRLGPRVHRRRRGAGEAACRGCTS